MNTDAKSEILRRTGTKQIRNSKAETPRNPPRALLDAALLAAVLLFASSLGAWAQGDSVTISAAEFQRLVYAAHLHTQLAEKPELDASLQVLLELHRRNPQADPAALAAMLREATAHYRTGAPAYVRAFGCREEILAAYLEALRQVPARTNFVPATLQLLSGFMLQPDDYTNASSAELIHSGNQRLLAVKGGLERRRLLLDAATGRAGGNATFATALDYLLMPEISFSVTDPPAGIIGTTNSPLHDNLTMQTLLALSAGSGNGSLTVSSNQLMALFSAETQTLWDTVHTNLALQAEFNRSQPDLLAYLTNQAAQADWTQREASVRQGQARRIACSTAAILVQSSLLEGKDPLFKLPREVRQGVSALNNICNGIATAVGVGIDTFGVGAVLGVGGVLAGGLDIVEIVSGEESPDEAIVREIGNTQTLIRNLSANLNYRFDRVDQSLTTIFDTLNQQMEKIVIIGGRVDHIDGNVEEIRRSLVDVQTDLHRLERHLLAYINQLHGRGLNLDFNTYLGYEATYGDPMGQADYNNTEAHFFTHAWDNAVDGLSAPYQDRDYTPAGLHSELTESGGGTTNRLDQNLNYIKLYLSANLSQQTASTPGQLANPRDWFVGAYAYAQLALENPLYFRQVNPANRLDLIAARGNDLTNFCRSLTFSGANLNSDLYSALGDYYAGKLTPFLTQVSATEQQYASAHGFALNTWRQWSANAPRVAATATEVLAAPSPPPPILREVALQVAGGFSHSLALRRNGTVLAWGRNDEGQSAVPAAATNMAAIAAGGSHSLAARSNGLVLAWGSNAYGQTNTPAEATNVIAVSAGHYHSLALRADGTVVGWGAGRPGTSGFPHFGQATVPDDATNLIAIAAGGYHSLALRADGTLRGWGLNNEGQLDFPAGATNVIAIAAGHGHNLVLRNDGALVAWGNNVFGSTAVPTEATNIVAIAAAGWHCLAQRADGTVFSWGRNDLGQTAVPLRLGLVQKLAAGYLHSLALKADGTVVAWGRNQERQCLVPPALSWRGAIAAGEDFSLALRADGTVVGWGNEDYGRTTIPASATNGVAIAAGSYHGLALRADGTVVGWGVNSYGQTTIPAEATNGVAIAAGVQHSLALRADGTVVGWGYDHYGQTTIPPSATNVVAIAAGGYHCLALRADGTVVGWGAGGLGSSGWPHYGQTTIPPRATNVVAIAAGELHSMALRADGTVVGWGGNDHGQTTTPPRATNVVAIAAGGGHSLALRADGTVVGWGNNSLGQTTIPASATNVVALAAGYYHSLALQADGTVVGWGGNSSGQTTIPPSATNVVALAAGDEHSLALQADGSIVAWGGNSYGQIAIPTSASNVVALAADSFHSLALRADGSVVGWGGNSYGQITIPASATNVVAIAAALLHSLALRADGTVVGWGDNSYGQRTIPPSATNVVALAAGGYHSLALRADGSVVGWGGNSSGQVTIPASATNVVAIAAGGGHSLALRADGSVVGWGDNSYGQRTIPASATNVVAIAAGAGYSLALRADGTVVGWGRNSYGQITIPASATNVVAIVGALSHSLFLKVLETTGANGVEGIPFVRARIPEGLRGFFQNCNQNTMEEFSRVGPSRAAGTELSGAKALFSAVLELGLPYALERDAVLHGFLYGSEPLVDLAAGRAFLESENAKLETAPDAAPQNLTDVAVLRYLRFAERLNARLTDLAASGQPELPRLVDHTLRLLSLLREAWTQPTNSPPPALELWSETNSPRLLLHGEPYAHYTLQYSDSLAQPGWFNTTVTNLHNEQLITPPISGGAQRFYRALLPLTP